MYNPRGRSPTNSNTADTAPAAGAAAGGAFPRVLQPLTPGRGLRFYPPPAPRSLGSSRCCCWEVRGEVAVLLGTWCWSSMVPRSPPAQLGGDSMVCQGCEQRFTASWREETLSGKEGLIRTAWRIESSSFVPLGAVGRSFINISKVSSSTCRPRRHPAPWCMRWGSAPAAPARLDTAGSGCALRTNLESWS